MGVMSKDSEKNLDREKILDKMRELRDNRDLQISEGIMEKRGISPEEKEKLVQTNKVLDVKYLGKIDFDEEIDGEKTKTQKDIYLVIEQMLDKEGNLVDIEKIYMEDGEFLGGNNKSDKYNVIMLSENYKGRKDLAESLQSLDTEGILDLNEMEHERLEEIAKELGISVEELDYLSEIDLEQIIEGREENDNIEELEGKRESKEGKETLTKKQVEKISTKSEIKTQEKVNDRETMAQLLGVQDKGYKKIAIVYSDKLQKNGSNTRFSVVGVKEDGSAEKIDTLESRYGTNPTKKIDSLNRDGSEIKEQQSQTMLQIKGRKEEQVAVRIGTMGTIEASLVRTPRQDNTKGISIPIATQNVRTTTRETRELMNTHKNISVKEETERIDSHRQMGDKDEDITLRDINDNPYDDTHQHMQTKDKEREGVLDKVAKEVLKNDTIAETFNIVDVKQHALKVLSSRKST